jgi:ATPase subunit of ABC transporter with duplicated ATPase domains
VLLNSALEKYAGIFIFHDREFVSSLAKRVLEMTLEGIDDFKGKHED